MSVLESIARVISFNVLQTGVSKIISAASFAMVVRLLGASDIGVVGLTTSYVALVAIFQLAPETFFLRDFAKAEKRLNDYITSYFVFGLGRGAGVLVLQRFRGGHGLQEVGGNEWLGHRPSIRA